MRARRRQRQGLRVVGLLAGAALTTAGLATATLATPPDAIGAGPGPRPLLLLRPAAAIRYADLSLSAGRLSYVDTDLSAPDGRGSVWQRAATRDGVLVDLGDRTRLLAVPASTGTQSLARNRPVLSTSAARAVVEPLAATSGTVLPYDLLDRGVVTGTFSFLGREGFRLRASGPYTLVERYVYRADGEELLDLTSHAVHTDLYGSSVIYSNDDGSVRVRDLSRPRSATNPRTLAKAACTTGCPGPVAIWGTTVAWTRPDGALLVRTLPAAKVRVVQPLSGVFDLRLSEGTLSWHTVTDTLRVLNLRSATSSVQSVSLTGADVDDHLIAGVSTGGGLVVRPLPFGLTTKYRPRLIGTYALATLTPNADGRNDVWAPQFDVSKPIGAVKLLIQRNGALVRTLAGTAADGSVRDIVWDGRDDLGTPAADGVYTWRLTGTALDGDGTLTGIDGTGSVTGTVTLSH